LLNWIAGPGSWVCVDAANRVHGRIDQLAQFEPLHFWWQTCRTTGLHFSLESAKHEVECTLAWQDTLDAAEPPPSQRAGAAQDELGILQD
jgi:hypothetical protein